MKQVALVQAHYTDLAAGDRHCLQKLVQSGIFEEIVIIAPDMPENEVLRDLAKKESVRYLPGDEHNIVSRMQKAIDLTKADYVARVLLYWFYLDTELINSQLEMARWESLDYVYLPHDFDIRFGADVMSARLIQDIYDICKIASAVLSADLGRAALSMYKGFRPWHYFETAEELPWRRKIFKAVPEYNYPRFLELRQEIEDNCPVAWDYGPGFYHHEYKEATRHIDPNNRVLDIGCGWGTGTAILAEHARETIGIDIDADYVLEATKRNPDINFLSMSGCDLTWLNDTFDVVTCVHTLEHIKDHERVIREAARVLRPGGKFIGEVPLRMARPFSTTTEPFGFDHEREYTVADIHRLLNKHFDIVHLSGVNRGVYTDLKHARNAVAFVCRQKEGAI